MFPSFLPGHVAKSEQCGALQGRGTMLDAFFAFSIQCHLFFVIPFVTPFLKWHRGSLLHLIMPA